MTEAQSTNTRRDRLLTDDKTAMGPTDPIPPRSPDGGSLDGMPDVRITPATSEATPASVAASLFSKRQQANRGVDIRTACREGRYEEVLKLAETLPDESADAEDVAGCLLRAKLKMAEESLAMSLRPRVGGCVALNRLRRLRDWVAARGIKDNADDWSDRVAAANDKALLRAERLSARLTEQGRWHAARGLLTSVDVPAEGGDPLQTQRRGWWLGWLRTRSLWVVAEVGLMLLCLYFRQTRLAAFVGATLGLAYLLVSRKISDPDVPWAWHEQRIRRALHDALRIPPAPAGRRVWIGGILFLAGAVCLGPFLTMGLVAGVGVVLVAVIGGGQIGSLARGVDALANVATQDCTSVDLSPCGFAGVQALAAGGTFCVSVWVALTYCAFPVPRMALFGIVPAVFFTLLWIAWRASQTVSRMGETEESLALLRRHTYRFTFLSVFVWVQILLSAYVASMLQPFLSSERAWQISPWSFLVLAAFARVVWVRCVSDGSGQETGDPADAVWLLLPLVIGGGLMLVPHEPVSEVSWRVLPLRSGLARLPLVAIMWTLWACLMPRKWAWRPGVRPLPIWFTGTVRGVAVALGAFLLGSAFGFPGTVLGLAAALRAAFTTRPPPPSIL